MSTMPEVLAPGGTVVTANNRLARSLVLAFDRARRAQGRRAWESPAILPWTAWIEQLWWHSLEAGGAAGRHRLLNDVQVAALWVEVVGERDDTLPGQGRAAAKLAQRAWRLCQDWRIGVQALDEAADTDDACAFAAWAGAFAARCDTEGWTDRRAVVGLLAADVQRGLLAIRGPVCLAGFDQLAPLQQQLIAALQGAGILVRIEPAPSSTPGAKFLVECRDERHEIETAARWARAHRESDPAARVGVVVPDLAGRAVAVRREFLDVFVPDWRLQPRAAGAVNVSFGDSLARTGVCRAAQLIVAALGGDLDYREIAEWLRSPHTAGGGDAGTQAGLARVLRQRIGIRVALRTLLPASESRSPWLERLEQLLDFSASLPARQRAAGWAASFGRALQLAGWPGERPLASDEFQAAEAVQKALADLRSCDAVSGVMDLAGAIRLFSRLAEERLFQPAGDPDAVQVLGVLEALGQDFEALWICGLSADAWPPPARPEALIGLALQRRLGLPDSSPPIARERAERELRWLLGSANAVVASWPQQRGEEAQLPSPLVAHLERTDPAELSLWPGNRAVEALFAARRSEILHTDPPPPVTAGQAFRGGTTLLEQMARCPARAYLEFRLGAREREQPAVGIDAASRGKIVHAVLAALFARVRDQAGLLALAPAAECALVDELIGTVLRDQLPFGDPLVRALAGLEAARLRRLLADFLAGERRREPFRVLATEAMPAPAMLPPSVASLQLTMRPDRVDEMNDGQRLVVDYKTGRQTTKQGATCGWRPCAPQLPLYVLATDAAGMAFVNLNATGVTWSGVGHRSWGVAGVLAADQWSDGSATDWSALRQQWRDALDRLAREFLAGSFTVDRWRPEETGGQWAMALRVQGIDSDDEQEPEEEQES
ncbi:MAG: PD-(D/E)XK nuclease family protein [Gammaproteobacteria bacterium]|nr:PD-(D/E)XK nuclease family protein [Gammaproteobacteria bacterium]